VAWGAAKKATELGAKVITISGPDGYIYDPAGLDDEKIEYMLELRASGNDVCQPYEEEFEGSTFFPNKRPWEQEADIYLPCATQNELNGEDADPLFIFLQEQKGFAGWDMEHPIAGILDKMLGEADPDYKEKNDIKWNFTKFLINKKGIVVARFEPTEKIENIEKQIEELLK
jgi:hypothetical protein